MSSSNSSAAVEDETAMAVLRHGRSDGQAGNEGGMFFMNSTADASLIVKHLI
jgi:hypothetical protein